jgi:segregation and condensation protein B
VAECLRLLTDCKGREGGLQIVEIAGGFQLSTKQQHGDLITRFLNPRKRRLSRSILETLAIIAYRQPITIAEIEAARGVNSDYSVRTLSDLNLIEHVGRKETVGRPMLYGTTVDFLHQFNLRSLEELPPLEVVQ